MNNSKVKVAAAAIACLAIAAAVFIASFGGGNLVLRDGDTGQEFAKYPMEAGEEFSITFIHSVNATPVTDYYDVDGEGTITLLRTEYYGFGAGVPFDLNPGEELSYSDKDGAMVISGINRVIPDYLIFVGTVSDHTLRIGEKEISLRDLCGRNTKVRITYEP